MRRFRDNRNVKVGCARMSRTEQKLEPQRVALLTDGGERVFEEKISSRETGPPYTMFKKYLSRLEVGV
jgi:hypothetical protein